MRHIILALLLLASSSAAKAEVRFPLGWTPSTTLDSVRKEVDRCSPDTGSEGLIQSCIRIERMRVGAVELVVRPSFAKIGGVWKLSSVMLVAVDLTRDEFLFLLETLFSAYGIQGKSTCEKKGEGASTLGHCSFSTPDKDWTFDVYVYVSNESELGDASFVLSYLPTVNLAEQAVQKARRDRATKAAEQLKAAGQL